MLRIVLFLATNFAILILASITLNLLGVNSILQANGVGLDVNNLLVFCAVFGFGGAIVSLLLSKRMALWGTKAQIIKQPRSAEERWLVETVRDLAQQAQIGMPDVAIFPADQANAFATGASKNNALVAVSSGLLNRFQRDETRAVLAHEVAHVANGDMVTLTLIQGVVNTFVMFFARIIGHTVDRVVFKTERGHGIGYYIVTIVAEIILGILASMIVAWFSRYREYRADAGGAQLAGSASMIAALQRLQVEMGQTPDALPDTMLAFGIERLQGEGAAGVRGEDHRRVVLLHQTLAVHGRLAG